MEKTFVFYAQNSYLCSPYISFFVKIRIFVKITWEDKDYDR